jgi:hypothetical protein
MRISILAALTAALLANVSLAKLPPLTDEAKAKAAEAAAKSAWTDKVGLYQLCKTTDRLAAAYRASPAAAAAPASTPTPAPASASAAEATPPCVDPGPYVAQAPTAAKPLEASEAHSPAETATGPPSSKATSAEITGPRK